MILKFDVVHKFAVALILLTANPKEIFGKNLGDFLGEMPNFKVFEAENVSRFCITNEMSVITARKREKAQSRENARKTRRIPFVGCTPRSLLLATGRQGVRYLMVLVSKVFPMDTEEAMFLSINLPSIPRTLPE